MSELHRWARHVGLLHRDHPKGSAVIPSRECQAAAVEWLRGEIEEFSSISTDEHERVQFVDAGQRFDTVSCPVCGADLEVEWWQETMDADFDDGFDLKRHRLPCCGVERTLNDLDYDFPQGFARFELSVMNPSIPKLSDGQILELTKRLGLEAKQILRGI